MMIIGKSRNNNYLNCGKIYALYVSNNYQKLGIGKSLVKYGFKELSKLGYKEAIICCLKDNKFTIFYEHIGGIKVDEKIIKIGNEELLENIYYYKDINKKW